MLKFFYTFPPFRQANHWLARRVLLCPFPTPTPPITFLMILSLSIILLWVLADVLKLILAISRTDVWSQASFLLSPPGGLIYFKPIWGRGELNRGRELTWFRKGDGSLTTIFIWNYPTLPLKNQKISNNAGKGGTGNLIRLPFCLFPAQTRRPPFFDWTLPEWQPNYKKWGSSRTRRLEVMQPRIRIKSELLECRERLWETKARNDQKSNICQLQIVHCIRMKISDRNHSRWPRF